MIKPDNTSAGYDAVMKVAKALHESMSQQDIGGYLGANIDAEILARVAIAEWQGINTVPSSCARGEANEKAR